MTIATATQFHVPSTVDEAVRLLRDDPTSLVACGGTLVMPLLARNPDSAVIDISALPGIASITTVDGDIQLGAAVTYSAVLHRTDAGLTLLRTVARGITGGPQIRNQGTLGGSACYANPASDVPTALLAADATMTIAGPTGTRAVPAAEFFRAPYATALEPGELLVGIRVPGTPAAGTWGYHKLLTAAGSWPIAVAAAYLDGNTVTITVGAATETPVRLPPLDLPDPAHLSATDKAAVAASIEQTDVPWWHDELADAAYRRRVATVVAVRAITDAARRHNP
jgi:aerobic carbon-monoxide dehydrogenase medium subunit